MIADFTLLIGIHYSLQSTCKTMVKIPMVNRGDASLEIHFSVLVECSVGVNLQFPQSLAWHRSIIQGWLILVAPRRPAKYPMSREKEQVCSGSEHFVQ